MSQNPAVADLMLARQMLREGAGLSEIAEVLDLLSSDVDLMLWIWFGASAGQPTPSRRAVAA